MANQTFIGTYIIRLLVECGVELSSTEAIATGSLWSVIKTHIDSEADKGLMIFQVAVTPSSYYDVSKKDYSEGFIIDIIPNPSARDKLQLNVDFAESLAEQILEDLSVASVVVVFPNHTIIHTK